MKVALVVHRFPKASETFIVAKLLGLYDCGLDVHVVAAEDGGPDWNLFPRLRDPALRSRIHTWPTQRLTAGFARCAFERIGGALVHGPGTTAAWTLDQLSASLRDAPARIAFALPLIRLQPDLVHFEFGYTAVWWITLKDRLGFRAAVSLRGADIALHARDVPGWYDHVWPRTDRLHCLGRDLYAIARERGCPVDLPWEAIPPAVDADWFRPRAAHGADTKVLRVLSVGRLHSKKGYGVALEAIASARARGVELCYRIAGSGAEEPLLRQRVAELGLGDVVELLGHLPPEGVRNELDRADVFLHAALSEGFGNAVLEAQAMEVPVVCSDAEGLGENVADGVTGIVVARGDSGALATALLRLAGDRELRHELGRAGRSRVLEKFCPDAQIEAFLRFYDATMTGASASRSRGPA